jgi:hypothetical protein
MADHVPVQYCTQSLLAPQPLAAITSQPLAIANITPLVRGRGFETWPFGD